MPRGKYVNHKGRNRHFTSPEELQQEESSSSGEAESSEEEEGAAGTSNSGGTKPKERAKKKVASSDESDDDDDDDDEEEDLNTRKGVASLIEIENPNRSVKKSTKKVAALAIDDAAEPEKPQLSRREREQIEKQKARQRYEKLHAAGKTTEAKADLARLALIRQQRAEAAAKREADKKPADDKKSSNTKT